MALFYSSVNLYTEHPGWNNYFGNDAIKTQQFNNWLQEAKQYFALCQKISFSV